MPISTIKPDDIVRLVSTLLSPVFHLKTALSVAHGVLGVMHTDRLGIHAVGNAVAKVRGTNPKHAVKQFDRLLSNERFDVDVGFKALVPFLVGGRTEIVVALDWTEYGDDRHSRIALNLITTHGRATPLLWKTVRTEELKDQRNAFEDALLAKLHHILPPTVCVTILADRGFGDAKLYDYIDKTLGWKFIIRFRGLIQVTGQAGVPIPARELVPARGRAAAYDNVELTARRILVPRVVAVHDKRMKEPWLLASNRIDLTANGTVQLYGRRFTIEENFRDEKDRRFGLGLVDATIGSPMRRDRMLFVVAIATMFLTLLGAAGEEIGLDRKLRANTETKRRTHSLFRQGREYIAGAFRRFASVLRRTFRECLRCHARNETAHAVI